MGKINKRKPDALIYLNLLLVSLTASVFISYLMSTRSYELPEPGLPLAGENRIIHDRPEYEIAWVIKKDEQEKLITVQTLDTKIVIQFRVTIGSFRDFKSLVPVTIECAAKIKDECDFSREFRVYAAGRYVEVIKFAS